MITETNNNFKNNILIKIIIFYPLTEQITKNTCLQACLKEQLHKHSSNLIHFARSDLKDYEGWVEDSSQDCPSLPNPRCEPDPDQ